MQVFLLCCRIDFVADTEICYQFYKGILQVETADFIVSQNYLCKLYCVIRDSLKVIHVVLDYQIYTVTYFSAATKNRLHFADTGMVPPVFCPLTPEEQEERLAFIRCFMVTTSPKIFHCCGSCFEVQSLYYREDSSQFAHSKVPQSVN